ncbi:HK97 gp10 family phage protein [Olegusella massiliensis]|uniref:HK97 gp10 family phage protein n=1 Tax=Olegusella massiliensis TaxID=1776381 RepID=UPI000838DD58|nr:HK97 gp10 family phage protein [Olegusella massiliensis]
MARGEINQHGVDLGMIANNTRGLTSADVDGLIEIREDNREQIANAIKSAIAKGLETIGLVAEGYAKADVPVDTGRLRNSITHTTDDKDAYIGTNVEYAPYVEFNEKLSHPNGGKAHFLRDAAADHASEYAQIMRDALGE